ncbi:hypothetical protein CGLO_02244 [Colletotrichum gloeosporioides Cg-14]|jgi:hypothetical protein
MKVM